MFHHASPPYLELNTKPVSESLNFPRGTDPLNHSIPYIPCDGFNLFQTLYFHIFSYIFPYFPNIFLICSQYFPNIFLIFSQYFPHIFPIFSPYFPNIFPIFSL